jgi:hypothetical protein
LQVRGVVHQNDIEFPLRDTKSNLFADRPQKGVSGSFQCDASGRLKIFMARGRIGQLL